MWANVKHWSSSLAGRVVKFWGKQVKEEELMKAGRGMEVKHKYEKDKRKKICLTFFFFSWILSNEIVIWD